MMARKMGRRRRWIRSTIAATAIGRRSEASSMSGSDINVREPVVTSCHPERSACPERSRREGSHAVDDLTLRSTAKRCVSKGGHKHRRLPTLRDAYRAYECAQLRAAPQGEVVSLGMTARL